MPPIFTLLSQEISKFITAAGISFSSRQDNPIVWETTLKLLPFIPTSYSTAYIEFYLTYQRGQGGEWLDIAIVLKHDNKPCGVWPLSFSLKDNKQLISSYGLAIMPPLFKQGLAVKSKKKIIKQCQELLNILCTFSESQQWESVESFTDQQSGEMSYWHLQAMANGATADLRHDIYIDLALEISIIKSHFRKSYKSLITSGQKKWNVNLLKKADPLIWTQFQNLHVHVAGRETRNTESWNIQLEAIATGDGFLIYLTDENNMMVGGGFFNITKDEGLYSVGVYERSLFDNPLGHVVQYRAIEEMKLRGIRWYKIGMTAYSSENPTEKDLSIAHFKQGFATHVFPQYKLINKLE